MIRALLIVAALLAASPALAQDATGWQTFKGQGSAPAAPPTGRYRLYFDGSGNLKWKNSAGTVFTASTGGGGGSVDGLKAAYEAASTSAQNILSMSTTLGSLRLRDNATPITGEEIFAVENSTGSVIYFSAFVNGVYVGKPLTIDAASTINSDVTLSAGVDINGSTTSKATFQRTHSTGSAPTVALGISTGAGESITVSGTDEAGIITIVIGASGISEAGGFNLFTVTFNGGAFTNNYSANVVPASLYAAYLENQAAFNTAWHINRVSSTQWAWRAYAAVSAGGLAGETLIYHYSVKGW